MINLLSCVILADSLLDTEEITNDASKILHIFTDDLVGFLSGFLQDLVM